jgi:hypothetical protein
MRAALIVLLIAMGVEAAPAAACTLYAPERTPRLLMGVDLRIIADEDGLTFVTSEEWVLDYLLAAVEEPEQGSPIRAPEPEVPAPSAPTWLAPLLASGAVTMIGLGVLVMRRRRAAAVAI